MDALARLAGRLVLEDSLLDFTQYMFKARTGVPFIVNWHHEEIARYLEMVVNGTLPDGAKNLIINMPPRYGKTECAVISFMAWCFARNPAAKFIHLSYADKLVLDNSSQVRELVKHEAFRQFWELDFKVDTDAKGLWRTMQGGGLMASPAGGTITGFGAGTTELGCYGPRFAGAIIIDDPLKPDDANSETERTNVNARLVNTIMSRRNSRETPIILIMQRLHEDDMTGFVLAGSTGEKWHHLKLPALDEQGHPLWEHKHNALELLSMKASSPLVFSGQYQQEPAPEEGVYFRKEWFKYYDELPRGTLFKYGASDYAVTEGGGDWTVHGVIGLDHAGDIYVLDWWRGKTGSDEWVERFLDMMKQHQTTAWAEEKGQIARTLGPYIRKRQEERGVYGARVQFASTSDKSARAVSIQARMATRGIYVPRGKAWVADLIHECMMFPNGKHDDQVDVLGLFGRMLAGLKAGELPKPETTTINTRMPTFEEMRKRALQRNSA